jgi:hypothetical protein
MIYVSVVCELFMYRHNTNDKLTVAEVHRRLRAVKRMLNNKSQVLYYRAEVLSRLNIELTDVENFYTCPISFDKRQFLEHIGENKDLFDRSKFIHTDVLDYVSVRKKSICKSFAVTAMLFTKSRHIDVLQKHVIVCIGSIYHAPRLFYKDVSSNRVVYEKCTDYIDLL